MNPTSVATLSRTRPVATCPLFTRRRQTELRYGHIQGSSAGVEATVPVAVAPVAPGLAAGAVLGAADRVGLSAEQRVDEGLQQLAQQIRAGLSQLFFEQEGGSILDLTVIVGVLLRVGCESSLEGSPDGRRLLPQRHAHRDPYTTLPDATGRYAGGTP